MLKASAWADSIWSPGRPGNDAYDQFARDVAERRVGIEMPNAKFIRVFDEDDGRNDHNAPTRKGEEAAALFSSVVHGAATPISLHHEPYMATLVIRERSKADDPRALRILLDWCGQRNIPPYLENVDQLTAVRFMDEMTAFTGLSWATNAKYLGRLTRYWKWMLLRMKVKANPFQGLALPRPSVEFNEQERAFTDAEVQKLLMGDPDPGMLDVMLVSALTGAGLDAVLDLRVGKCADGWFTFRPQKKEKASRDVPIHPYLATMLAERLKGKSPEDDLFPEWPVPKTAGSVRERSSYFSKRFTKYRRELKVDVVVAGKRRSLVNFNSFRRWFITKAERAAVNGDLLAAVVGHKRSGLTLGRYPKGLDMDAARSAIAKVLLPPLDGSPVQTASRHGA